MTFFELLPKKSSARPFLYGCSPPWSSSMCLRDFLWRWGWDFLWRWDYIYIHIYIYIYIYIDRERERERKGKYPKTDPAQKDAGLERGKVNIITVTFTKSIKVNNILLYYWANDTVEDVILWCWKFRAIALRYVNSYFKRSETQFVLWCMQF